MINSTVVQRLKPDSQANTPRQPVRRIPRAILMPVGEEAQSLAERVCDISRAWLNGDPPLVMLANPGGDTETATEASTALDRLSSQEMAADLARRGFVVARTNEIHLWLLVHVGQAEDGSHRPQILAQAIAELEELAWQRLRVHTVPHALLLAEPAHQDHLLMWAETLAEACADRIFVAGPVTHDHVRLTQTTWLARSAVGLAALLWSAAPSHSHLTRTLRPGQQIQALGAAAWPSPVSNLNAYLAQAFARRVLDRLGRGPVSSTGDTSPHPTAGLMEANSSPEREVQSLAQAVPPAGGGLRWGNRRPGLMALASLPDDLRRAAERREKQMQLDLRRTRQSWLAERLAHWQGILAQRRQESLAPNQAWPDLAGYEATLHAQRSQALQAGEAVESQLERWGDQVAQAENRVDAAAQALQEVCDLFPTPDLRGAIATLTRPWRIFGWAWAYLVWLPKRAQQMLDAQAQRAQLQWQDANWHVIRQFYLAQAQDLQLELAEVEKVRAVMEATTQALTSDEMVQTQDLAPWTSATLEDLGDRLFADDALCAWGFLETLPLSRWPTFAGETLAAKLVAWAAPWLAAVDGWTAADCLAAALDDSALEQFVSSLAEEASPLWPDQDLQSGDRQENRFLLPPIQVAEQDDGQGQRLQRVQAAAQAVPGAVAAVAHADLAAWVRLAVVDLALDLPEFSPDLILETNPDDDRGDL